MIQNVHLIEEVFDEFPSFHDAEVLQINLNREIRGILPTLETLIHVFKVTSEIKNERFVTKDHCLVTFQFLEIDDLHLDGFNHQNVLQGLSIIDISKNPPEDLKFEVGFDGIFGVDERFKCRSIKIVSVTPFSN